MYVELHEEQHIMDGLPPIPHVMWMHAQGMASLGYDKYSKILSIQAESTQAVGSDSARTTKPPGHHHD